MKKKYFGTDGIRGTVNIGNINGEKFFKFGLAAGTYFKNLEKKKQIAIIAKDTRLSGYTLEPALVSGLASAGPCRRQHSSDRKSRAPPRSRGE